MFKLSCADFTFPLLSRKQTLTLLHALNFEAVDVGLFARSTHFSPNGLIEDRSGYTRTVKNDLGATGLGASDVFLQIGMEPQEHSANDPNPSVRAYNRKVFEAAMDFCLALDCHHMTGLPGVRHPEMSLDESVKLGIEEAAWRVHKAAEAGIVYAIEPHIGSICATPQDTHQFLRQVGGLTLALDYGHFIWAGFSNDDIHQLVPYASHLHVRGGAKGRLQTPVEENIIDFPGLLKRLRDCRYEGFLCMEYVWIAWEGCNRVDNISETILLRNQIDVQSKDWT
jgi:sugar phosphate isomerase/epimerase